MPQNHKELPVDSALTCVTVLIVAHPITFVTMMIIIAHRNFFLCLHFYFGLYMQVGLYHLLREKVGVDVMLPLYHLVSTDSIF